MSSPDPYFGSTIPLGLQGGGEDEWRNFLWRRAELIEQGMRRLGMAQEISQSVGLPARTAYEAASYADAESLTAQQMQAPVMDEPKWRRLIGAAQFYGIENPEQYEPQLLEQVVEAARGDLNQTNLAQDMTASEKLRLKIINGLSSISLFGNPEFAAGVLSSLRDVPFAGDWLARKTWYNEANRQAGLISEAVYSNGFIDPPLPPRGLVNFAGESALGAVVGAYTGGTGWLGGISNPIIRGGAIGAVTGLATETGGEESNQQKAIKVAEFTIGGAVLDLGISVLASRLARSFPSSRTIDPEWQQTGWRPDQQPPPGMASTPEGEIIPEAEWSVIRGYLPGADITPAPSPVSMEMLPPAMVNPTVGGTYNVRTTAQGGLALMRPRSTSTSVVTRVRDPGVVESQLASGSWVDDSVAGVIDNLNRSGIQTIASDSGVRGDHPGYPNFQPSQGYIAIPSKSEYAPLIQRAAQRAGLAFDGDGQTAYFMVGETVRVPKAADGTGHRQIVQESDAILQQRHGLVLKELRGTAQFLEALHVRDGIEVEVVQSHGGPFAESDDEVIRRWHIFANDLISQISTPVDPADAAALTKQATVLESPLAADLAHMPRIDEAEVALAAMARAPGQISVIRDVGDTGKVVRKFLQEYMPNGVGPQDFRVIERTASTIIPRGPNSAVRYKGHIHTGPVHGFVYNDLQAMTGRSFDEILAESESGFINNEGMFVTKAQGSGFEPAPVRMDILISDGSPISNKIAKQYESFGMFSGQQATTAQGLQVTLVEPGAEVSKVRMLGGEESLVPTRELFPQRSSFVSDVAPEAYQRIKAYVLGQMSDEALRAGLIGPELAPARFTTAKGSVYEVRGQSTVRDKAPRAEHPGSLGPQPRSQTTVYVDKTALDKLAEFQTQGQGKRLRIEGGYAGVEYTDGPDAGKIEQRTVVQVSTSPEVGLHPVEVWNGGKEVHFGNEITEIAPAVRLSHVVTDWFSEELASQLPRYVEEFLDAAGIEGPAARGAYKALFTELRVREFKTLAPEEFAQAEALVAEVNARQLPTAMETPVYLEEVAETKGMRWIEEGRVQQPTGLSTRPSENFLTNLSQYTPVLYRETTPSRALGLAGISMEDTRGDVFFANTTNFALGQERNRGVLLEFDTGDIRGQVNTGKPAWEFAWDQGGEAEFVGRYNAPEIYSKALRRVTIPNLGEGLQGIERTSVGMLIRGLESQGWQREVIDRAIVLTKPKTEIAGRLQDSKSGEIIPFTDRDAALQFLQNLNRELPDYSPESVVPAELVSYAHGASPGVSQGPVHTMDEGRIVADAMRDMDRIEQIAAGGGEPPDPPSTALVGTEPPEPPMPEETLGGQFAAMRGTAPTPASAYNEVMSRFDNMVLNLAEPMRNSALHVERVLTEAGISKGTYWEAYSAISNGRAVAHNEATPMHREVNQWLNQIRRRFVRDGTVTLIGEVPRDQAIAMMQNAGYNQREMGAQLALREMLERWRQEYEIAQIMDYMPHLRAREARGEDWGHELEAMFGGPGRFFAEMVREGSLDVREMNASVLLHRWARAATFHRHVAPHVEAMRAEWVNDPRVPDRFRQDTADWLSLVVHGHTMGQQVVIPGVRQALNAVGVPVTNAEVARAIQWMFTTMYRGALGGRPDVLMRDMIGPLFGGTKIGFTPIVKSYTQFLKGGRGRDEMWNLALEGGWVEREMVPMGASEMFSTEMGVVPGTAFPEQPFSGWQNVVREGVARTGDVIRDAMPTPLRSGITGTWADPIYGYSKLGQFNRLISGHAGYTQMRGAIAAFDVARTDPAVPLRPLIAQLLRDSGAASYHHVIQRKIAELVTAGQYEEAARLFANEVANSQFRYGTVEAAKLVRQTGVVGKLGSTFGTFTNQYVAQMRDGFINTGLAPDFGGTSTDRVTSATKFAARQALVGGALAAASAYTLWNFNKWYWHGSLGWGGGPMALAFVIKMQEYSGRFQQARGEYVSPIQEAAIRQSEYGVNPWTNLNPLGGTMRTIEGLGTAISAADPFETTAQFLVTGRLQDASMVRMLNDPQSLQWIGPQVPGVMPQVVPQSALPAPLFPIGGGTTQ